MAKKNIKTFRHTQGFYPEPGRRMKKGIFITFEGTEGCGKSTHARLLFDHFKKEGYDCLLTREPGGTLAGEKIRDILLHSDKIDISDMTELFLFEAARAQIVKEIISPAITRKKIVICDRYSDATLSYQGYGGRIERGVIEKLNRVSTGGLAPDLTLLLDIDVMAGLERAKVKGCDRMEKKGLSYHKRVRSGYLAIAKREPGRVKIIRVVGSIEDTQETIRKEADIVVRKLKRAG